MLERLVREGAESPPRRSWRLRQWGTPSWRSDTSDAPAGPHDTTVDRPSLTAARSRRPVLFVAGALGVVALVVVLAVARRPPPIEERLPLASSGSAPDAAAADPDPAADVSGSGTSGGDAAPAGDDANDSDAGPGGPLVVHVAGAVASPGVVRLAAGARVVDAVTAAGGLRADADPDRVNLAAPLGDGQRVVVPVLGQPAPVELTPAPASGSDASSDGPGGASDGGAAAGGAGAALVDINTATAEQLDTLPGVGPSTAAAILEHRDRQGPFTSVDELLDVRGIGDAKLEALRDLVTVGP